MPLPAATILYNGIRLTPPWPPVGEFKFNEPMSVPYLSNPPAVITVDVGRQLFVDDFLIESTTLKRVWHKPVPYTNNPVLKPDKPWEMEGKSPMAMVFSDGVWFDPKDQLFKMWYMGGYGKYTCYAYSSNGVDWIKPELDVVPGSNIVQKEPRDSSTVWLDQEDPDPKRRYKMFRSLSKDGKWGLSAHFSEDGIHWSPEVLRTGPAGDRTTVFRNPFRGAWVFSLRGDANNARVRRYWEMKDIFAGPQWEKSNDAPLWVGADRLDPPRPDLGDAAQLYNLDAIAYEGLFVGLFSIWRGDRNIPPGRPKPNSIWLGFSRDGYHWDRPDREPFIDVSEKQGDWNWGNVQSAGGGFLVHARQLLFYFSGRAGAPNRRDAGGATGLAYLRRDGFCSMEAGPEGGVLTTRPVKFNGGRTFFVNADVRQGELRAEILDENNQPIVTKVPVSKTGPATAQSTNTMDVALSKESFGAMAGMDQTLAQANWGGVATLDFLRGRTVKFRFHLKNGKLYSFWVSPLAGLRNGGASGGFVAAGGPHFDGPIDRIVNTSYRPWPPLPPPATNAVPATNASPAKSPPPAPKPDVPKKN
ncbi:MAG: glycosyl hydrolase family 32 [Verrucomicrobia bacterium]|nr:glycosyl hydrolase family 32 [Verrucomicrobiota bacterium]